jgi:hypothetical protein
MTQLERKWSELGNGEEETELVRNTTGQTDKRRTAANIREEKKKLSEKITKHGIKKVERERRRKKNERRLQLRIKIQKYEEREIC